MAKSETVAEFLARGGKITKVDAAAPTHKPDNIKATSGSTGMATIVSMDDADLYHGESKKSKAKKKPIAPTIDISALPEELRKKYVDEVVNAKQNEEDDDDEF